MKIIVCIKQVIDPEAPVSSFKVDPEARRVIPPKGTPPVLNPFDQNALEAALKIKDTQGAEITVIMMGRNLSKAVARKSLAVSADRLILLEDDTFEDLDSYATVYILVAAIKRIGEYDLILCGRQASDTDAGVVGSGIAEILGIPSISVARKIDPKDKQLIVERVVSDGYIVIQVSMSALITTSNEVGELRSAALPAIMAAQKKEITVWNAIYLGVEPHKLKQTHLLKLFQPVRDSKCEFIEGKTPEEKGVNLALQLKEAKLI
jgi:electron transfer flavoprotein beta subunit